MRTHRGTTSANPPLPNPTPSAPVEQFVCTECEPPRSFPTKIGLGVHRKHQHPVSVNAEIDVARKHLRNRPEEMSLAAAQEAYVLKHGHDEAGNRVRFINIFLAPFFPGRSVDGIKGVRKSAAYRQLLDQAIQALEDAQPDASPPRPGTSSTGSPSTVPPPATSSTESPPLSPREKYADAIRCLVLNISRKKSLAGHPLALLGEELLRGHDVTTGLTSWLAEVAASVPPFRRRKRRRHQYRRRRRRAHNADARPDRLHIRRREYASMQTLFDTNMSRAAKKVLDGDCEAPTPCLARMVEHWQPVFGHSSVDVPQHPTLPEDRQKTQLAEPILVKEVDSNDVPVGSAPGIDGITPAVWRQCPPTVRALLYNMILYIGSFPVELLASRTVFVPKKANATSPSDFRPISITSVVVRQLHKILAARMMAAGLLDKRQRCLEDGCAECIAVLASTIHHARVHLRELHVVSLDVAKAFDSVSHQAITSALTEAGVPTVLVEYVKTAYQNSTTILEVRGKRSEEIVVNRGVRQGDPMSTIIFSLVTDRVLRSIPSSVGYHLDQSHLINAVAYADDICLVTSSTTGMSIALAAAEKTARQQGLAFNPSKCVATSIVPSGRDKKVKILTEPQFTLLDGDPIRQLGPVDEWRYLGVNLSPVGVKKASPSLEVELQRITRAPLTPQQRLKILRCFLVTRYYHLLVLSGCTMKVLRQLDLQTRAAVRRWLRLPKDVPVAYIHASCRDGGLGIPSFVTSIPGLVRSRLMALEKSSFPSARAAHETAWVQNKIEWTDRVLNLNGERLYSSEQRAKYWAGRLYESNDGRELRDCSKTTASTRWIDASSLGIPGKDYIQYHHTRINSLPTRVRTSRGQRLVHTNIKCRAGCSCTETAAHVIQSCFRTHGGRIKRHDAVCKTLADHLRARKMSVRTEPHLRTSLGLKKPDLLVERNGRGFIVDAQIVSGALSLDDSHRQKVEKYNLPPIKEAAAKLLNINPSDVSVLSCTLSWRGVWSGASAQSLRAILGIPVGLLAGITTRVIQGSHTNWTRWNQMTTVVPALREGVG